jgi:hypothetical protein
LAAWEKPHHVTAVAWQASGQVKELHNTDKVTCMMQASARACTLVTVRTRD